MPVHHGRRDGTAVGVPAVKPVETEGGCSYLLNPTDVMPSWNISDPTVPPFPPSVDFYYYTDKVGIDALNKDLRAGGADAPRGSPH